MLGRVRRAILLAIVAAVVAVGVLVLIGRPKLDKAQTRAVAAWHQIQPALERRYRALHDLERAMTAHAPIRDAEQATVSQLARWDALGGDLGPQVDTANRLEGLGRRLVRAATDPAGRYQGDASIAAAVRAYQATAPHAPDVTAFNRAVGGYRSERDGFVWRVLASPLGFDPLSRFEPASVS
jgi:hypothetical protein